MMAAEEELLREGRQRRTQTMLARERMVEAAAAVTFVLGAAALLVAFPPEGVQLGTTLALVAAYAVVSRIEYHAGAGYTVPTQLIFVPMLLLTAPSLAPVLVAAGFLLGELPGLPVRPAPAGARPAQPRRRVARARAPRSCCRRRG